MRIMGQLTKKTVSTNSNCLIVSALKKTKFSISGGGGGGRNLGIILVRVCKPGFF